MTPDDILIIIIIGAVIVLALYFIFNNASKPIHNAGQLPAGTKIVQDGMASNESQNSVDSESPQSVSTQLALDENSMSSDDSSVAIIADRASGGHKAPVVDGEKPSPRKYRHVSYKDTTSGDMDKNNFQFLTSDVAENNIDKFVPVDESGGENAMIRLDNTNRKNNETEKYNIDSFLPKEKNKDWFETIDAVDVKNTHLINIYRPIGVNTIGTSLRNASYDLRGNGDAICPQYVVSPWLQSTIQPDRSMKTLC